MKNESRRLGFPHHYLHFLRRIRRVYSRCLSLLAECLYRTGFYSVRYRSRCRLQEIYYVRIYEGGSLESVFLEASRERTGIGFLESASALISPAL